MEGRKGGGGMDGWKGDDKMEGKKERENGEKEQKKGGKREREKGRKKEGRKEGGKTKLGIRE